MSKLRRSGCCNLNHAGGAGALWYWVAKLEVLPEVLRTAPG